MVYLRNGTQLEPIRGIREKSGTHCQIVDKGLKGLQHYFRDLKEGERTPTADLVGKVATLQSPSFWRYKPSTNEWVRTSSSKKSAVPQGGGIRPLTVPPETKGTSREPRKAKGCKRTRTKKVTGKCVSQPIRPKLDFISMRQAAKRANKTDQPMYLCVLKATEHPKGK